MSDTQPTPAADKGLLARAVGVLVSPADTFKTVVAHPRPAGILFLVCAVLALAQGVPQLTERGRQAALELQLQQIRDFGREVTPEMQTAMESRSHYSAYFTMGSIFVFVPVVCLIFGAIYWALFNTILGGTATFKQVLGIVTHSQVIAGVGAVLAAPIQYAQGIRNMAGPFNLGALAPMLEPGTFLARFLGALSVITFWQIVVNAIGLGVLYRRRSTGIAIGLTIFYLVATAGIIAGVSSLTRQ